MHYLITGHTGFKGAWLSLMLHAQGHTVSGISLDPPSASLFSQAKLSDIFVHDLRLDIRDEISLNAAVASVSPDVIIHLAAQPLVQASYFDPVGTFQANVIGTLNVLESTRKLKSLKATLVITTDKVYRNVGHLRGYTELDELGGEDPYSASKAAADIAAQSWRTSFANSPVAIARAGNVIGGGDWASNRIIPDLVKAYSQGNIPRLRHPDAIRPWQHVLDCLQGYISLVNEMLNKSFSGQWNFGPSLSDRYTVSDLVEAFSEHWFEGTPVESWQKSEELGFPESTYLLLDSTKARNALNWNDQLSFSDSVKWTTDWYKNLKGLNPRQRTLEQIKSYFSLVKGSS